MINLHEFKHIKQSVYGVIAGAGGKNFVISYSLLVANNIAFVVSLPPTSLFIVPQLVNCCLRRNHLHNSALRVTIRPLEMRNAFCPIPVKAHRKPDGERFYAHESLEIWLFNHLGI